jgi:hypothetical protein
VWYSLNGERLGTYDGHCGAVWCLDPKWDTTSLVTGWNYNISYFSSKNTRFYKACRTYADFILLDTSVPDPPDPHVFGPP